MTKLRHPARVADEQLIGGGLGLRLFPDVEVELLGAHSSGIASMIGIGSGLVVAVVAPGANAWKSKQCARGRAA